MDDQHSYGTIQAMSSINPIGPNSGPKNNQSLAKAFANAEAALDSGKEALQNVFDTEVMGISGKQAKGGVEKKDNQPSSAKDVAVSGSKAGEYAALIEEMEKLRKGERKKKKRSSDLEQTFDELQELEDVIDPKDVTPEEKGIIEEFFDNLARIKNLRKRLKQLKEEEKQLKQRQKEQERKTEEERQNNKKEDDV